ncbi:MAG: DNA-3-methyladenine glycosylase 2 family protein [Patescibacteria group bacterium]
MKRKKSLHSVYRHFEERDPVLFPVLAGMELTRLCREEDVSLYFSKLCREIISQQLGSRAAAAIAERFTGLFDGTGATPAGVLEFSEEALRGTGMSWAKARSVRDLAERVAAEEVCLHALAGLDDEAAIAELTKIKGIGRWTAEMFLIFTLGREDVFSFGDLGLKKGMEMIYGKRRAAAPRAVGRITALWAPCRS